MLGDELIGHLLVLHGIHPSPIEYRTSRVIEGMRATLFARGAEIELTGIEHGVAILRLSAKGCGTGAAGIEQVGARRGAGRGAGAVRRDLRAGPADEPGDLRAPGLADAARPGSRTQR